MDWNVNKAEITTIIPTYRRPRLLLRAIDSVLSQTHKSILVKVFDNDSGDETEAVVRSCMERDDRVVYHKNESNIGPVKNIIQGVNSVTTDYYSILNDDDFLLPHFYEKALCALNANSQAGFVCTKTITVDLMNMKWQFRNGDWDEGLYEPSIETLARMYRSHFTQTGVLLRREMRERIGPFEQSGDDMLYQVLAAAATSFVVLNYYGAAFLVHPESSSVVYGLRRDSDDSNQRALLSTIEQIVSMSVSIELKAHLIMLVCRSYGASFDNRKLENYLTQTKGAVVEGNKGSLPSIISSASIFSFLYERSSPRLRPVLTTCINLVGQVRRWTQQFVGRGRDGWIPVPEEARSFCEGKEADPSSLLSSLRAVQAGECLTPKRRSVDA